MKRFIIAGFCIISSLIFCAEDNINLHYDLRYSTWASIYPNQPGKKYNYNDLTDLKAGCSCKYAKAENLWLLISFFQDEYEKNLRLESTGFEYVFNNMRLGYSYERSKGFGNYSRIYPKILRNRQFEKPFIYDYNFNGIFIKNNAQKSLYACIGGNEYNNFIADAGFQTNKENQFLQVALIYIGRDNYYQNKMLALNCEGWWNSKYLWIYGVWSGQFIKGKHISNDAMMQNIGFMEIIVNITDFLNYGGNYQTRYLDNSEKEKHISVFAELNYKLHELSFIYSSAEYDKSKIMDSISFAYWLNLNSALKAGLFADRCLPETGNDYYEAGIQLRFYNENN